MTLDLGESDLVAGEGSQAALDAVRKKALELGAADAVLVDARERFVNEYAYRALAANARYQGDLSALGRALAPADRRSAGRDRAASTAPTRSPTAARGKGNDQVRIEVGVRALAPRLRRARAAAREAALAARCDRVRARSTACRSRTPRRSRTRSTRTSGAARSKPACSKTRGTRRPKTRTPGPSTPPTRPPAGTRGRALVRTRHPLDGRRAPAQRSSSSLNKLAGANGVGRIDMIEDRVVGLKSREVYECPGSVTLIEAHIALERLVLTREELRLKADARPALRRADLRRTVGCSPLRARSTPSTRRSPSG